MPCQCKAEKRAAQLRRLSRLSHEMIGWSLANTERHPGNAAAYDAVVRLAEQPQWFLTLHGENGRGKSRLLAALCNETMAAGRLAVYMTTAELMDYLRATFHPKAEATFDALWDRLQNVPVLALDEFDRFNPTPWAEERFFALIEHRYRNGSQMLTALATNKAPADLPAYLYSRVRDRRCVMAQLTGVDRRRS